MYPGFDYGIGTTNLDRSRGIRYGVIPENVVGQRWYEEAEPNYGNPTCGKCGNQAVLTTDYLAEHYANQPNPRWIDDKEYLCPHCQYSFESEEAFPEQSDGSTFEDEEYRAASTADGDIFITKSPYYTRAQYCSPCAPGAGYLNTPFVTDTVTNAIEFNYAADVARFPKVFCFNHDWFEEGKAPYRVFRADNNEEVLP